ncbi:aspartyl-phosphate phosphatase Spo0E family protein [Metabacillus niabensis]|uniref:Aspartyl-phosphate phosphatase Spo0E family protein n=1 Tax=Metabacillus niabensis TaxID=324854 RepID=A0ABT9YYQ5_9BACI|nr:aspartyl-phosphate phosphatase Spo0E family protein [Metabacillus niabensis]MDQ0224210.1 hypothetical protein [Metabacillus niabensis]PAD68569.1 hypothetical protein CHH83_13040 [Bacillus sp. 7586-K]
MFTNSIELKRKSLLKTALQYGINSSETITCSQELDILLLNEIKLRNSKITSNQVNTSYKKE